jgi:hypothetical protein
VVTVLTLTTPPLASCSGFPTTAAGLLTLAAPFGPTIEGFDLVFTLEPPPELDGALNVLHTGLRAQLAARSWYGCGSESRTARPRILDPAAPIPADITLLCVEGDPCWDRIDLAARLDFPAMFDK